LSFRIAGPPEGQITVPATVRGIAGQRSVEPIWINTLGGVTYKISDRHTSIFVKWGPPDHYHRLHAEAQRMQWAYDYTPVPKLLDIGQNEDGAWLVSEGIEASSAVSNWWKTVPKAAVDAIGQGLAALHQSLPVPLCPFKWSTEDRVSQVMARASNRELTDLDVASLGINLTLEDALAILEDPPTPDLIVVCHGDACAPNTLIDSTGRWAAHVDLGSLGISDRWADLAIASWSLEWNFGSDWESRFFKAYGIDPDPSRILYYRLLWALGP